MNKLKTFFCFISLIHTILASDELIYLENQLLHTLDGKKGMIDETSVYKMTTLCKKVNKFQYGKIDKKTKKRIPQHKFQSKYYNLKELVQIENDLKSRSKIDSEAKKALANLEKVLEELKDKMARILKPFLVDARGSYTLMVELIKESCAKRNRMDSELLRWNPKNEEMSFKRHITSINDLDIFCTDLVNLQKDIVYSCPKATSMY